MPQPSLPSSHAPLPAHICSAACPFTGLLKPGRPVLERLARRLGTSETTLRHRLEQETPVLLHLLAETGTPTRTGYHEAAPEAPTPRRLALLGVPRLEGSADMPRLDRKTAGVLAFLALEPATHKYRLAGMLWPESGELRARNNMRQLLHRLRSTAGALLAEAQPLLRLHPSLEVDLEQLERAGREGRHAEVLRARGELLAGLDYDDCPDFAEWLAGVRERLRSWRLHACSAEVERLQRERRYSEALLLTDEWLALDTYAEEAWRQRMRLQALAGDRGAILATFARMRALFERELSVRPDPVTLQLVHTLTREVKSDAREPDTRRRSSADYGCAECAPCEES